jgi:hypothetical protein
MTTKKQIIQDLKDYFRLSELRRSILANETHLHLSYEEKVKEVNSMLTRINMLAFEISKYPIEKIH